MSSIEDTLSSLREALANLQFGTITVTVHDGQVVQIDRTEKLRVARGPRPQRPAR